MLESLKKTPSNPTQVNKELNMCSLEKKYGKSMYVAQS